MGIRRARPRRSSTATSQQGCQLMRTRGRSIVSLRQQTCPVRRSACRSAAAGKMADNRPGFRTAPSANRTPVESPQNSPSGRFNLCGAALSAGLSGCVMPHRAGNQGRSVVDRSVGLSQLGVFGEPPLWREMQIAYNGQVLWPANAFQDG
jgi:hypothetical protein